MAEMLLIHLIHTKGDTRMLRAYPARARELVRFSLRNCLIPN